MKQSSKQNTIKTTKPVASDRAGFLTSTVQDTTGWSGDHDDNKVEGNFMALATDASTTITDCDTNYPDLWANAPTAWRSGSDLVIPSQGNAENIETTATLNWTAGTNVGSIDSSSVVDVVKAGRLVTVSGTVNVDLTSTGSFSFNCPTSDLPFALEDHRVTGAFVRTTNPTTTNTGDIAPSAASTTINFRGTATVNTDQPYCFMFYYHTTDADVNTTDSTPVIQLVDNIAAGALGLPAATADEAGTVESYEVFEDDTNGSLTLNNTTGFAAIKIVKIGSVCHWRVRYRLVKATSTGSLEIRGIPTQILPSLDYTCPTFTHLRTGGATGKTATNAYLRFNGRMQIFSSHTTANFGVGDGADSGLGVDADGDWINLTVVLDD